MSVTRKKRLTICTYFEIRPQIEACVMCIRMICLLRQEDWDYEKTYILLSSDKLQTTLIIRYL